jgi:hypothetical protein
MAIEGIRLLETQNRSSQCKTRRYKVCLYNRLARKLFVGFVRPYVVLNSGVILTTLQNLKKHHYPYPMNILLELYAHSYEHPHMI